MIKLKENLG
nr:unnamed protein product [Callosobruchus chinensis]